MNDRVPHFYRVAAGDYETQLAGRNYRLIQLDGGATRAWNVERVWAPNDEPLNLLVDGAATKRDALALFAAAWRRGDR